MADQPLSRWFGSAAAALAVLVSAHAYAQTHYELVLLGGQSNMGGSDAPPSGLPTTPVNLQLPQDDVFFFYRQNGQGNAVQTTLRPGTGNGGAFGPEVTFGRAVADALPQTSLGLVKHARGGTSLADDWDATNGNVYRDFRETVDDAVAAILANGDSYEITAMLWTQGESDGLEGTSAQYQANLTAFIADVRSQYGADLPFFLSQLSINQTAVNNNDPAALGVIRGAQSAVASADANTYLIDTDAFGTGSLHFNAAGQIALGEAYAAAYLGVVPEPGSLAFVAAGLGGLLPRRRRRDGAYG
ncbi:MAG: sialate O-acetylesterase [Planctomycetota bacterium]